MFEKLPQINEWLATLDKKLTQPMMFHYGHSEKWKPMIERIRGDMNRVLLDIPLANKRNRVLELCELYKKAKHKPLSGAVILRQIATEVEGDQRTKDGQINNYYQSISFSRMTDTEVDERIKELVKRLKARRITDAIDIKGPEDNVGDEEAVRLEEG